MANIQISKLNPSGSELFSDSESYLNELSEQELANTTGGLMQTGRNLRHLTVVRLTVMSRLSYVVSNRP